MGSKHERSKQTIKKFPNPIVFYSHGVIKKSSVYEGIAAILSIDYQFQARFHRTELKPKGDFFPLAFHLFVIGFILWRKKVKIVASL